MQKNIDNQDAELPSPYSFVYNINPVPKVQEMLKKQGKTDNSKQRISGLAVKLFILGMSETIHMKTHQT